MIITNEIFFFFFLLYGDVQGTQPQIYPTLQELSPWHINSLQVWCWKGQCDQWDLRVKQKVLHTRAVYQSQTGEVAAEEISDILEKFEIKPSKIVAVTVDNAGNMDVAIKKLQILKIGCFAHTLNLAAQKIYKIAPIDKWAAWIRAVVVWFKRSSLSKTVLMEKQQLLGKSV